jgi:hypothetical protein
VWLDSPAILLNDCLNTLFGYSMPQEERAMNRNMLLIGTVAVFGLATAMVAAGDATRAAACDESAKSASASSCCAKSADAATASSGCTRSAATTTAAGAGGDACCKSGKAASASAACDKSKTDTAFNGTVDEIPYRENKRLVLTGVYMCGHCNLKATESCSPMFKTADGKVYPLLKNPESNDLRGADTGNGVEIASSVVKIDGIKYLEVKSYKAQ